MDRSQMMTTGDEGGHGCWKMLHHLMHWTCRCVSPHFCQACRPDTESSAVLQQMYGRHQGAGQPMCLLF
jgi:hypothetical protein